MKTDISTEKMIPCSLGVTDNARKGILKLEKDEFSFFLMQSAFDVHIEKRPENKHGNMSFSIYFDNETNDVLSKQIDNRVAVMECIYKNESFLATGFHIRGRRETVRTNRRLSVRLKFQVGRNNGTPMPIDLYTQLRELPVAEERSEYVKKRIASWEGYLRIQEKNADVADIKTSFIRASLNEDFSKLSIVCNGLKENEWNAIKGFSVKMIGLQSDIGNVINVKKSKSSIEIELTHTYKEKARRNEWHPTNFKEVVFSNFAELSQVKRLRKGFKDLQDGLAANSNLERILFEERPTVRISKSQKDLDFHNVLNEFQKEAVVGALTSNDLYVIQGPPGTGKTTVISEICHQNVKAGMRTLVASQANLAVDNALGRLLSHQDIRILRYGRTESIEEEGKKFIEENVSLNWKYQTIEAITQQIDTYTTRKKQLECDLQNGENQFQKLQKELATLQEKIRIKDKAQAEFITATNEIQKREKYVQIVQVERDELAKIHQTLLEMAKELTAEIKRIEKFIETKQVTQQTHDDMQQLEQHLVKLRLYVSYREIMLRVEEVVNTLASIHEELENNEREINGLYMLINEIEKTTKLDGLQRLLHLYNIVPPLVVTQKINELTQLIELIKLTKSNDSYEEWVQLINRLSKAITTVETLLKNNGFLNQSIRNVKPAQPSTVKDINDQVDKVGRFLIDPSVKRFLDSRHYSAEKYEYLEKMTVALEVLRQKRNYALTQIAQIEQSKALYIEIKTAITGYVNDSLNEMEQIKIKLQQKSAFSEQHLDVLQQKSSTYGSFDESNSIETVQEEVVQKEESLGTFLEKKRLLEEFEQKLQIKLVEIKEITRKMDKNSDVLNSLNDEIEVKHNEIEVLKKQLVSLEELLAENPEELRKQVLTEKSDLVQRIQVLKEDLARLPITHTLQQEWLVELKGATEYDLDEIRKMYVRHANVIGTTCVASARRDFMEEYPTFDVVIIDEVSKATPPELLLPMLKGKKIILVGDHHQLPPLVGQETLDEFLEESDNYEEKNELQSLLKESLFERLFRTLPKQNKTMLAIQYRMHESIMETITPFYEEGNYSLQCGLNDSDATRDHLIDSKYVKRKDHLLWFDMPNKQEFFEEKVKGGTSRFNQSELNMIKELLLDLDSATENVKKQGELERDDKKSVGVISFYGEQVKRIDRLIKQELIPKHLYCRTGTVDKFQGMEMDIIILSFVRNHHDKGGDIGFAKDYRRLNVALSRARELLIIVGSSEMFTIRTKDTNTREMYGRLLTDIKKKNGFRDTLGIVK